MIAPSSFYRSMFKQSCTNLLKLPILRVRQWLSCIDTVLADGDGVLWIHGIEMAESVEVMNRLKSMGKKIYVCTNNSVKSRKDMCAKAVRKGILIDEHEVLSSAYATAAYLKQNGFEKCAYIIGMQGIADELDAVGIRHTPIGPDPLCVSLADYVENHLKLESDIGAVIVGFDEHFSFPKVVKAGSYLMDPKVLFIATNRDEIFPMERMALPGSGSFVSCVKTMAGRSPITIGKPNRHMCRHLIKNGTINPERTLMIGDRCNTDVLFGFNCGFHTMLVGTGVHKLKDVRKFQQSDDPRKHKLVPDVYLPKLGDLLQFLGRKDCA